jgi:hypothetical protein
LHFEVPRCRVSGSGGGQSPRLWSLRGVCRSREQRAAVQKKDRFQNLISTIPYFHSRRCVSVADFRIECGLAAGRKTLRTGFVAAAFLCRYVLSLSLQSSLERADFAFFLIESYKKQAFLSSYHNVLLAALEVQPLCRFAEMSRLFPRGWIPTSRFHEFRSNIRMTYMQQLLSIVPRFVESSSLFDRADNKASLFCARIARGHPFFPVINWNERRTSEKRESQTRSKTKQKKTLRCFEISLTESALFCILRARRPSQMQIRTFTTATYADIHNSICQQKRNFSSLLCSNALLLHMRVSNMFSRQFSIEEVAKFCSESSKPKQIWIRMYAEIMADS